MLAFSCKVLWTLHNFSLCIHLTLIVVLWVVCTDDTSYRGKIDWDTDPIVRLMGGKEDVATLRVVIRELTTF